MFTTSVQQYFCVVSTVVSAVVGVPMEGARRSEFVMIALTSHGGHMGFIEGVYPRHTSYMFRVFAQFAAAMVQHGDV